MALICTEVITDLNSTMAIERRMLGIYEVAGYLGLSTQTIRNKLSAGTFPIKTKRIGRLLKWDRKDVDHYLDKLPTIN
jgi:excisionase family DNA binding protein